MFLRSSGLSLSKAFAKASPANKESCEKNPNEDCGKGITDKDPSEKALEGKDPNYDKCVTDKPCDKDQVTDKDPGEKGDDGSTP